MAKTIQLDDTTFAALFAALSTAGATATPPVVTTPPAPSAPPPPRITYPIALLYLADALYLYRKDYDYKTALAGLPGTHQLHYDILCDMNGKTWWELTGNAQAAMQQSISRAINLAGSDHAAEAMRFDTTKYTGPLAPVYVNLVAAKLAGKA